VLTYVLCPPQCQHMGQYRWGHCHGLLSATDNLMFSNGVTLSTVLLRMHGATPHTARQRLWFHDRTWSRCREDVRLWLSATCPGKWNGPRGQFHGLVTGSVFDGLLRVGIPEGTHFYTPSRDHRRSHSKNPDSLTKVYAKTWSCARVNAMRHTNVWLDTEECRFWNLV
jgi:hypothetical protein